MIYLILPNEIKREGSKMKKQVINIRLLKAAIMIFLIGSMATICRNIVTAQETQKPDLFSEAWMQRFAEEWNKEPEVSDELAKINFTGVFAYGFINEDNPRGVLNIENGKVVSCGAFSDQNITYDLRASKSDWEKWLNKPPGSVGIGMLHASKKLQFKRGDFSAMMKYPIVAVPFIKTFVVMGRI